jgi:hypothetical protein
VILDLLRPFTERLRGTRTRLADTFSVADDEKKCAAEIGRWRYTVQRRIRSDLLFLKALEALLTSSRPRHQQIVYGLIELLRWSPRTLADRHGRESLKSLAEELEEGCASGKRMHLRSLVERIFRPLHQDPSLAGRTLYDFVPEGRSPAAELVLWCEELGDQLHAGGNPEGTRS